MSLKSSLHLDQNERLRDLLKKNVPPYSSHGLTRDLCEEVIKSFGLTYPDEALSLCMRIAHRVAQQQQEGRGDLVSKRAPPSKKSRAHPSAKGRGERILKQKE